ncbi:flavin reductase family protein [Microterricola viridarii]|uniref:NADH-FMN oxidoreductase RutF, flavin reductase (DIM6/NTAB) family n=1 Tax=Microterricola viridarii TaxID=412690 RepID=A0A1H1X767_9MICO|nr:flavin reductase family protein [Microterricola viridarii]SDT05042.1 NADH-FMN oxidoreductase RutF, flavin reductase (DIM6/NTAB) family [Microterricola viridarii]
MPTHFYRPAEGHRLPHDPFNAIVAPRPIGWIGTLSTAGVRNLAPYSFFNALSYTPPLVGFSSTSRKHSARNAEETGEFTWNLVTRELAEQMNASSLTADVDEFAAAGLAAAASVEIAAPRVAASPVSFECRVADIVPLRGADGRASRGVFTIGEVVAVHIDEALLQDGVYQTALAHPVMRGGGPSAYFEALAEGRFDLVRPA